jgi:hypothetical protein
VSGSKPASEAVSGALMLALSSSSEGASGGVSRCRGAVCCWRSCSLRIHTDGNDDRRGRETEAETEHLEAEAEARRT